MDLVVRSWIEDDAQALGRAIAESLDHLRPWMPWVADEPVAESGRRGWIRERLHDQADGGDLFHGLFRPDGTIVGGGGLHRRIGPAGLEIGYWVHVAHTGRGIATEAARRLSAIAFTMPGIERVEIHHEPENAPSARVPERAGFTRRDELDDKGHVVWVLPRSGA